jgi:hypothetical protein
VENSQRLFGLAYLAGCGPGGVIGDELIVQVKPLEALSTLLGTYCQRGAWQPIPILNQHNNSREEEMAFIQIIELTTSRLEEANKLFDQWLAETQGKRTAERLILTSDRDRHNTYVEIVEFPSYEDAMRNSNLPETQAISAQIVALCDSEPIFRNLDVIRTEQ